MTNEPKMNPETYSSWENLLTQAARRCDVDTAFSALRTMSQTSNRKLREVAQEVVASVAQTG